MHLLDGARIHAAARTVSRPQLITTCTPVSYTHLDVYKRQPRMCTPESKYFFFSLTAKQDDSKNNIQGISEINDHWMVQIVIYEVY